MNLQPLLDQYGYLALLVGTFFEGETAILLASSLIPQQIFSFPLTILFAFSGSFLSDWLYYFIGRINGKVFIAKRPKLLNLMQSINEVFDRYQIQILLSYRFLYGFRVVIPVMIGMSGFKPKAYLFYTIVSGLLWATVVTSIGYLIGTTLKLSLTDIEENIIFVALGFSSFGLLLSLAVRYFLGKQIK